MTDTTFDNPPKAEHNADPAEIAKFESLASRWWDPHSEFKPLHDINPQDWDGRYTPIEVTENTFALQRSQRKARNVRTATQDTSDEA